LEILCQFWVELMLSLLLQKEGSIVIHSSFSNIYLAHSTQTAKLVEVESCLLPDRFQLQSSGKKPEYGANTLRSIDDQTTESASVSRQDCRACL